jgi:hypothetical protein
MWLLGNALPLVIIRAPPCLFPPATWLTSGTIVMHIYSSNHALTLLLPFATSFVIPLAAKSNTSSSQRITQLSLNLFG